MSKLTGSKKATQFTESVIREMTRLNHLYGGVNLSQGFPDFPAPAAIKEAACAAINADVNQHAVTWGARPLRRRSPVSSRAAMDWTSSPTSR
jgi:aminotransferase